jgi:hypothetical protein
MRRKMIVLVAGIMLAGMACMVGWSSAQDRRVGPVPDRPNFLGQKCIIYLSAEAAGAPTDRAPHLSNLAQVRGRVTDMNDDWLVVQ